MDGNGGIKWTGIRHFVRLKQTLQHWQAVTVNPKSQASNKNQSQSQNHNRGILSPAINKRLMNAMCCDSDEESCQSPEHLSDVPKGYLAVYVGPELRRFIIPTSYLSHLVFKVLLEKAEEEYGFDHSGGLTLPCEIETFKYLLKYMEVQQLDDHPDEQTPAESSLSMEG
ncbi:auxin-responsive protein SAUR71-like [Cucurbita maxima]|uniref:Auxin-responsive protein SAUR71-like n=1 Tax=Cucurbita maxima TaxID=3661 RepID=A0A6J1KF35_CUCMA|nr:auxin-responsive protein SAUR71-like [Cucurbita maxima]